MGVKSIAKITTNKAIVVGLLGAIIIGLGEYLLHFIPSGPSGEISMLFEVPLARARIGHLMAVAAVPFYFVGYYGLFLLFKSSNRFYATGLFILGVLSFTYGGIWISSRYMAAVMLQATQGTELFEYLLGQYEANYQILVWVLRILVLSISFFYVMCILKNKINLPKWLAIFNPIVLLGLSISSLMWAKPVGVHLAPIAMNTTHFIFFSLLLYFNCKSNCEKIAVN